MPLPKYFCDYCERSFNDTPLMRKKHFESKQHKMQVKMHYDSYKDPVSMLIGETHKKICKDFINQGYCEMGCVCPNVHPATNKQPPSLFGIPYNQLPPSLIPTANASQIPDAEWG